MGKNLFERIGSELACEKVIGQVSLMEYLIQLTLMKPDA
jgi:hypothetical protein